jgi:hypothetical protein
VELLNNTLRGETAAGRFTVLTVLLSSKTTASFAPKVFGVAPVQLLAVTVSQFAFVAPVQVSVAGLPSTSSHSRAGVVVDPVRFTVKVWRVPTGRLFANVDAVPPGTTLLGAVMRS